jgi:hypothetical protein
VLPPFLRKDPTARQFLDIFSLAVSIPEFHGSGAEGSRLFSARVISFPYKNRTLSAVLKLV